MADRMLSRLSRLTSRSFKHINQSPAKTNRIHKNKIEEDSLNTGMVFTDLLL